MKNPKIIETKIKITIKAAKTVGSEAKEEQIVTTARLTKKVMKEETIMQRSHLSFLWQAIV
jgi:hypothetical protein